MPKPAQGSAPAAIQKHYDIGDEFYRLWLDPTLSYSCALWTENESGDKLEDAQLRKLDYHIDQARADDASRVLDVGCGWGALLTRLVEAHGVERAVGLTLSLKQAAHVASRSQPRVEARLESWMDHAPTSPYDAIISVGAFEHFAKPEWSDAQKVAAYRAFFERCRGWLKPGGRLSLQTIAYGNVDWQEIKDAPGRRFLLGDVFPESELPTLANLLAAWDGLFELVSLRNDRADYWRTCRIWFERLAARRAEAVALVGDEVVARYLRYLKFAAVLFNHGQCCLLRVTLQPLGGLAESEPASGWKA
jgi:cyclopropane-fatty-acyl-phospholipid synthase